MRTFRRFPIFPTRVLTASAFALLFAFPAGAASTDPAPTAPTAPAIPAVPPEKAAKAISSIAIANPEFETAKQGTADSPEGWIAMQHAGSPSYKVTLDEAVRRKGKRSVRIENTGPEPVGTVQQALSAAPYRGKTLRFSGWLRTEGATGNVFGTGAGLMLNSMRGGYPHVYSQMQGNAVNGTTDWTRYEVVLAVPIDADHLEIGVLLFGPGTAWFDDAALDIVAAR